MNAVYDNAGREGRLSFEQHLRKLEEIVARLEKGDLSLDAALASYEEGIRNLKECYAILEEAEKKVMILTRDGEGNLQEIPFRQAMPKGRGASPR